MIIKNLENKIKLAGILSIGCFATSIVISGMVLAFCFSLALIPQHYYKLNFLST